MVTVVALAVVGGTLVVVATVAERKRSELSILDKLFPFLNIQYKKVSS